MLYTHRPTVATTKHSLSDGMVEILTLMSFKTAQTNPYRYRHARTDKTRSVMQRYCKTGYTSELEN